ncbi:gluconate 2-dehydrogenase subunit 3 family protein [Deinococcus aerophilus]|uniref:Gluconate 2-dehydrogenase subunit 3 family protein n=1 Tax=Deinococcus aerophilus TaxID=522488 RepID=A0ABQ2GR77_9DEIO|nr:gluconate 2-dehydrogenase subunit 3 family protein [Deinococcus aerophilus]GGM08917.1 hypothetical protein GCM10010841_16660 [Deinococcus aerophilus]
MTQAEREAILELLNSPQVTGPTRRALQERLDARFVREFFDETGFARLRAVATRLVPHDPAEIDLAGMVDHRLHAGSGDGWRYADAPPDGEAYRRLLRALPQAFETLAPEAQDAALQDVQSAHPRAFEDLLAELTEGFMAHPLTQYRFGYVGFADAQGWLHVGPGELEPWEEHHGPR